jgi:hypothetical protein
MSIGFIVFLAHDSSQAATALPATTAAEEPAPAQVEPVAPPAQAAAGEEAPLPPPVPLATEVPAEPPPATPRAVTVTRSRTVVHPVVPAARRPQPAPAPAPVPVPVVSAPPAPVPVVAPPAAEPKPATDCSPPYYFEGQKKVFKPQCL